MADLISAPEATVAELRGLVARAESGDEQAVPLLRTALSRIDDRQLLERATPSPARWAERLTRSAICRDNAADHETIRRHCELLAAELEGPAPSAIERVLAARVVLCWLACSRADADAAHYSTGGAARSLRDFSTKQAARCERRLLLAAQALARVRRLALPRLMMLVPRTLREQPAGEGKESDD